MIKSLLFFIRALFAEVCYSNSYLYFVVLKCIVLLIYRYVDIIHYSVMHKFVRILAQAL